MTEPLPSEPLPSRPIRLLSDREVEVLTRWLVSESKREVAQALFITDATVHTHLARIRGKYQAAGRPANTKVALLIRAIEDGYVTLSDVARQIGLEPSAATGAAIMSVARS
ncbi:LuxR C-terminal-related transcriptional regulator [Gordonia sp. CPCC 205515]|uniref:response regulator transcription factor n=1 Tax=Gordonia sp. CPCC 205515 TaxID=3140791 RepID=UPI003AF3A216